MQSLPKQLTVRVSGSLTPLKTAILRWLSKGPRSFDDLVAAFGLSPLAIRRCLRELRVEGLVQVMGSASAPRTHRVYVAIAHIPTQVHTDESGWEDYSLPHYRQALGAAGIVPDDV